MENQESLEPGAAEAEEATVRAADADEVMPSQPSPEPPSAGDPEPAAEPLPSFIYALGEIDFRHPSLGLEKEVAQVMGRAGVADINNRRAVHAVIAEPGNRYLARGLCWVLTVEGLETYILVPRDPADYSLLIEAVAEYPSEEESRSQDREPGRRPAHVDVVIGTLGGIAPPEMCNALSLPIVICDQVYSFDRASLIRAIPTPGSVDDAAADRFRDTAGGFFDHIMRMADNAGATPEHRALNYLAVRYPKIYATVAEEQDRDASLAGIEARPSSVSGVRQIVDVIFSFTHVRTDVTTKYLARVDVNDEYPFLITPLSPYYDLQ